MVGLENFNGPNNLIQIQRLLWVEVGGEVKDYGFVYYENNLFLNSKSSNLSEKLDLYLHMLCTHVYIGPYFD